MFRYCLIFIFSGLIACQSNSRQSLENDKLTTSIFSSAEVKELQNILLFFESELCRNYNKIKRPTQDCYLAFFDSVSNLDRIHFIQMDSAKVFEFLPTLTPKTLQSIWSFSQDSTRSIHLNPKSKYGSFVSALAQEYTFLNRYYNSWSNIGDISPGMQAQLISDKRFYITQDPRLQLIVAIHWLTLFYNLKLKSN